MSEGPSHRASRRLSLAALALSAAGGFVAGLWAGPPSLQGGEVVLLSCAFSVVAGWAAYCIGAVVTFAARRLARTDARPEEDPPRGFGPYSR